MIKHNSHGRFRQAMRIGSKILSSLFVLYAIAGFMVLPVVLKHYLPGILTSAIKRPVSIKYVRFNPFSLSITMDDFKISGAKGGEFVSVNQLYGNLQLSSIWHGGPVVKLVEIKKPSIYIIKNRDGTFNFSDMLTNKAGEPSSPATLRSAGKSPGLLFNVCRISVKDADISYLDKVSSFSTVVTPLDISLTNITNARNQMAKFNISGKTLSNESFKFTGRLFLKPLFIEGHVEIAHMDLSKYAPFYSRKAGFVIKKGTADIRTFFTFPEKNIRAGKRELVYGASITLSSLELADLSRGGTVLDLPVFTVSGLSLTPARKSLHIRNVTTAGATIYIKRFADGGLNISRHSGDETKPEVKKPEAVVPGSSGNKASPGWVVDIDKISLENYALQFTDNVPVKPVSLDITPIDINGISFSNRPGSSGDVSFSFKTGKGIFAARGKVSLSPFNMDLGIKAYDIRITPVRPYVSEKTGIVITSGSMNASGHVSLRSGVGGISGGFTGDAALLDFSASNGSDGEEFVKWAKLAFSDIRVISRPLSVSMDNILLQEPDLKIVRLPEGALNLANAFRPPGPQGKQQAESIADERPNARQAEGRKSTMVPVNIKSIDIKKGIVMFTDREIRPEFECTVSDMNIRVNKLLFPGAHKADFTFSGKFENQAGLSASGELFPLDLADDTQVNFDFSNIGMPVFTPYFGHYLGYELKKGKLFLKLGYRVKKNRMTGENHVLFDKFYLGDSVKSPAAINLPLKLALAILRDRNGKISIDVPVRGDVENPEFRFGKVIYGAFVNLVSKIATSPFAALGSMFKNADQFGFVSFAPGTDKLVKSQAEKIRKLVYALYERPSLQLVIDPEADPVGDRQALVDREFMRRLGSEKTKKSIIKSKSVPADDKTSLQTKLTGEEYRVCLVSACKSAGIEVSGISAKELKQRLKSLIVISDRALLNLARKRGDAVRDAIREENKIKPARVFLTTPRAGSKSRVEFKLKAE